MRRAMLAPLLICSLSLLFACVRVPPSGAPFRAQAAPSPGQSLVYLYRVDARGGAGVMEIALDGQELGVLPDHHYTALIIPPGRHALRIRDFRLGFWPNAWTTMEFETRDAGTSFIRIWADYEDFAARGAPPPETPGRGDREARIGIFAGPVPTEQGLAEIQGTRHMAVTGGRR